MDVVLVPGLDIDRGYQTRLLSVRVNLDCTLSVGLPVSKQGRRRSIRVGQFDRVKADSNACLNLRQSLLGELPVTEKAIALLVSQLRELKVVPTFRSVYGQANGGCEICANTEVFESSQARVHRLIVLGLSLTRLADNFLKLRSLKIGGLALNTGNGVH